MHFLAPSISDRLEIMALNIERVGFAPNYVDYEEALALQREVHQAVAAEQKQNTVLLLEHQEVITAGKRTEAHEYPHSDAVPVIKIDRGGKLTWHGPGQLVGYPIVKLPTVPIDVVKHVRILEEIIINVLTGLGIHGERVDGRSGVWILGKDGVPDQKICAIGVRVSRRTTMHGFAINCNNNLDPFGQFIPCGITDAGVTSISEQLGRNFEPIELVDSLEAELLKYADQLGAQFEPHQ